MSELTKEDLDLWDDDGCWTEETFSSTDAKELIRLARYGLILETAMNELGYLQLSVKHYLALGLWSEQHAIPALKEIEEDEHPKYHNEKTKHFKICFDALAAIPKEGGENE